MTASDRPVAWISHRGGEPSVRCGGAVEKGQIILLDSQSGLRCAACGGLGDLVFLPLKVEEGLSVEGHEGVQVHEVDQTLGDAVRDRGRDDAAVAVPDQDDVSQVFGLEHREHVPDVGLQPDLPAGQVRALAEPRVGRGDQLVAPPPKERPHLLPGPARRPRAVSDQERRHAGMIPRR
jgi:hypothetical protein